MKNFVYVYIVVSLANETIHYTGITRDREKRLLGIIVAHVRTLRDTGRGELKLRLHSNPLARRVHSRNI